LSAAETPVDPLDAITEAVALHAGWLEEARRKGNADATVRRWTLRMQALREAAEELRRLRALHGPVSGAPLDAADLADLPPALIAELSGPKTDALEDQILAIVQAAGGAVELNRLLVELYRRHGQVHARKAINNKCYRMALKGLIHPVAGQRGAYTLAPE
jgi:hypothetical protein